MKSVITSLGFLLMVGSLEVKAFDLSLKDLIPVPTETFKCRYINSPVNSPNLKFYQVWTELSNAGMASPINTNSTVVVQFGEGEEARYKALDYYQMSQNEKFSVKMDASQLTVVHGEGSHTYNLSSLEDRIFEATNDWTDKSGLSLNKCESDL